MSPAQDDRPFAIYARLSRAKPIKPGQRRTRRDDESVERQVKETRAYATEHNLPVDQAHVYVDNHFSAWKLKGGKRPAWLDMMAAARAGEVQGILVWKLDRFTRAPRDMEDLIDLAENGRMTIDGPYSGIIDLTSANGRREARGAANQAASESDNTSERVRAVFAEARLNGEMLGGARLFGYDHTGDSQQRPEEVAIIREAAKRMVTGESLIAIAADLNARGLRTTRGRLFIPAHLGRMLGNARHGGFIEYQGKIIGRLDGEPVLDPDTYAAVQVMLASRRRGRRPTGKYELTGLVTCGRCGHGLNGAKRSVKRGAGRVYICPIGFGGCGVSIDAITMEEVVSAKAIEIMADADFRDQSTERNAALEVDRHTAAAHLAAMEEQLGDLMLKKVAGNISQAIYDKVQPMAQARFEQAQAALAATSQVAVTATSSWDLNAEDWKNSSTDWHRAVIIDLGLKITLLPMLPASARNKFDPRRIVIEQPAA